MKRPLQICLLLLSLALLHGCAEEPLPRGVVAQVNDQFIHLRTVETMLDSRVAGMAAFEKPSLATLKAQYGAALTSLIAHVVVMQELEERGLAIGEADVSREERQIREDYADDEFERNLTENAIDLDAWRELVRYRLGMDLFMNKVLRPTLELPLEEVEGYYAAHKDRFTVPRMLSLERITCGDKATAEKVRLGQAAPEQMQDCQTTRFSLRREALPPEWEKPVRALKPGEVTAVRPQDGRFEVVRLLEELPEKKLDIADAYPYIEQILMEDKLAEAFEAWLEKRLQRTKVRVSVHLLDEVRGAAS